MNDKPMIAKYTPQNTNMQTDIQSKRRLNRFVATVVEEIVLDVLKTLQKTHIQRQKV